MLEAAPHPIGNDVGKSACKRAMTDDADGDLLLQPVFPGMPNSGNSRKLFSVASIVQTSPFNRSR
jgi:hypothetical protein